MKQRQGMMACNNNNMCNPIMKGLGRNHVREDMRNVH